MKKCNGRWFHESELTVGQIYTISKYDSMSLKVGDKYVITATTPATVALPNFGPTDGWFVEMRPATVEEIEQQAQETARKTEESNKAWREGYGDPR